MLRRKKITLENLIKKNKEELLKNKEELDLIEKRIEDRHQLKITNSNK